MALPQASNTSVSLLLTTRNLQQQNSGKIRRSLNYLANLVNAVATGSIPGTAVVSYGQTPASGTLTISSGSGTVGGSINGVSITVTWATSDTATATALAAAINASANALVAGFVTATSAAGVVTVTGGFRAPGVTGNAVTLAASGTGVTASGARLTGGAETTNYSMAR